MPVLDSLDVEGGVVVGVGATVPPPPPAAAAAEPFLLLLVALVRRRRGGVVPRHHHEPRPPGHEPRRRRGAGHGVAAGGEPTRDDAGHARREGEADDHGRRRRRRRRWRSGWPPYLLRVSGGGFCREKWKRVEVAASPQVWATPRGRWGPSPVFSWATGPQAQTGPMFRWLDWPEEL